MFIKAHFQQLLKMGSGQPLELSFENFKETVSKTFTQLWSSGEFSDVSLVAEDGGGGSLFRAHKIVLSSASQVPLSSC